jgi:hypothetical protein
MSIETKALAESIKLTVEGNSDIDIKEWIENTYPDLQSKRILKQIPEYLKDKANGDKKIILGFCIEGTKELYKNFFKIGDFSGALKALQELSKLSKETKKEKHTEHIEKIEEGANEDEKVQLLRIVKNG